MGRVAELKPMSPKKRRVLIWVVVLVSGCVIAWFTVLTRRSTKQATSPDGRYVTTVRSSFPLSGGYRYDIKVRRSDGVVVRHLVVHDKLVGWGRDPSITWTTNSTSVTVGLEDGDTDGGPPTAHKRMSIDVQ
jgi:hypothetical protein